MSDYFTVPVLLTYASGEKLDAEITMPRKAYWQGQLEKEIMDAYNHDTPPRRKQGREGESFSQLS